MSLQAVPGLENVAMPRTIVFVQPTSEVSGAAASLYRLVSHLDPAVYRPIVVLPREGPLVSNLRSAGCRVVMDD